MCLCARYRRTPPLGSSYPIPYGGLRDIRVGEQYVLAFAMLAKFQVTEKAVSISESLHFSGWS